MIRSMVGIRIVLSWRLVILPKARVRYPEILLVSLGLTHNRGNSFLFAQTKVDHDDTHKQSDVEEEDNDSSGKDKEQTKNHNDSSLIYPALGTFCIKLTVGNKVCLLIAKITKCKARGQEIHHYHEKHYNHPWQPCISLK